MPCFISSYSSWASSSGWWNCLESSPSEDSGTCPVLTVLSARPREDPWTTVQVKGPHGSRLASVEEAHGVSTGLPRLLQVTSQVSVERV